jgi:hypothetical protein
MQNFYDVEAALEKIRKEVYNRWQKEYYMWLVALVE